MQQIQITSGLSELAVGRDDDMVVMTFAMKRTGLPPQLMAMSRQAASQLALAILGALSPKKTLPDGTPLRMGYDLEDGGTGPIGDGRVLLYLTVAGGCEISFALSRDQAQGLHEQLEKDLSAEQRLPAGTKPN
jgi:hypothetical protein